MEPGPDLDRLVAEKVLGLVPCDGWEPVNLGSAGGPALMKTCQHTPDSCHSTKDHYQVSGLPRFSTELAPAWRVWEYLRHSDRWCCLVIDSDYGYVYRIKLTPASNQGDTAYKHEPAVVVDGIEEFPLAVCAAALKAAGVRVED